jgi:hypothetical protein
MYGENLKEKLKFLGYHTSIKYVGGVENYLNILFDGDVKKFFNENNTQPYVIPKNGMEMYLHDVLVDSLGLPPIGKHNSKFLGSFTWKSGGINYLLDVILVPVFVNYYMTPEYLKNHKWWKVIGRSGDYGWGHYFLTKKQTIGIRGRQQVYKQIIKELELWKN